MLDNSAAVSMGRILRNLILPSVLMRMNSMSEVYKKVWNPCAVAVRVVQCGSRTVFLPVFDTLVFVLARDESATYFLQ